MNWPDLTALLSESNAAEKSLGYGRHAISAYLRSCLWFILVIAVVHEKRVGMWAGTFTTSVIRTPRVKMTIFVARYQIW